MKYHHFLIILLIFPLVSVIAQQSMEPVASFLGTHSSERVGYHLHTAGDVNGDGYDDFLIGTFHSATRGFNSGAAYLILGQQSAGWGVNKSLNNADAKFIGKRMYDAVGYCLAGGGDVNGDGYDDFIISAPAGDDNVPQNPGYVYIILGKANPNWGHNFVLEDGADAYYAGENPHDIAGISVAIAGDINGDGFDDFLVGVPYNDYSGIDAGKTYLILGKTDGWQRGVSLSEAHASFCGNVGNGLAGYSVDGVGDVNGDDIPDFVIGARGAKKVYLIFGRRDVGWGANFNLDNADVTFYGNQWNDWTGWRAAGAGDVNGDGLNDILIGAPMYNQDGGDAGKVYLVFGRRSGWNGNLDEADASFYGEAYNDQAGWDVQGAGDVNGDGYDDFVIGAWYNDQNGEDAGKMYLIKGKKTGWNRDVKLSAIQEYFLGEYAGDFAGFSAATAGDVNGDGLNDIVTSSTYYSRAYNWGGKISLFLGEAEENSQPELSLSSDQLDFADDLTSLSFTITNSGNGLLDWNSLLLVNEPWITAIDPPSGRLAEGASEMVTITIDRSDLIAGLYSDSIKIETNGGNAVVSLIATVPALPQWIVRKSMLDFGSSFTSLDLIIENTGNSILHWNFTNPENLTWVESINPEHGAIAPSETTKVTVHVNRSGLHAGEYFGNLQVSSEAGSEDISLKLIVYTLNTLYVKDIKKSPNAWTGKDDVYLSITDALNAATLGDQIWVAKGEYLEPVQLNDGIKLYGGFSGNENSLNERIDLLENHVYNTIINAQNADHCVLTASNNIVDGFKLINGFAHKGGGVSIYNNTNIELRNLFITECEAEHTGGGIDILAFGGTILIENIVIWKCKAICGALEIADESTAQLTARNCTIVNNSSYGLEVPYHDNVPLGTTNYEFYNCIVWENRNSRSPSLYSNVWAWARNFTDYSYIGYEPWNAVEGQWRAPLPNNIFEVNVGNPGFVDMENGDFQLSPASPCIGSGLNGTDIGAFPFNGQLQPTLSITPSSLHFQCNEGESNPDVQTISVSSSDGAVVQFTVDEIPEMDWLILSPTSGSTQQNIDVSIENSGLSAGSYSGRVRFINASNQNDVVDLFIELTVLGQISNTGPVFGAFEAEVNSALPNSGWEVVVNEGENCLRATASDISSPPQQYQLNYTFMVPQGVNTVYVFAEVDVNKSGSDDSFWITMNGADPCQWNGLYKLGDGWKRSWVFDQFKDQQHTFAVTPGENTLNLYPRERNAHINWLVVTADPDADIENYQFGNVATPPSPPPVADDPVIAVSKTSLSFSGMINGGNPAAQQLVVQNSGGGTFNWTAAEQPEQSWLTLSKTSGSAGESISVGVNISSLAESSYNGEIQISADSAANSPLTVPVTLTVSPEQTGPMYTEFQAEASPSLPNSGWEMLVNEGENCLRATANDISSPPQQYQLNYTFMVPQGVNTVYVFAEVDVNKSGSDDSFWITMNGADPCQWNGLYKLGDGWKRSWVFDQFKDQQHTFAVTPGENTLNLYPRERNAHINWLVVTADPDADIENYQFGNVATPPSPPPVADDPVIAVSKTSLSFSGMINGGNPAAQQLVVQNSGGGTFNWTAAEQPEQSWLTLSKTSGSAGESISVGVNISSLAESSYNGEIQISADSAANSPLTVPVTLTVSPEQTGPMYTEFQAEASPSLPNSGWEMLVNEGENCLRATANDISSPPQQYQLNYTFMVPQGVNTVYVFAEVDVNKSGSDDSFWITMNGADPCQWNGLYKLGDGWKRSWVFDQFKDQQHTFAVTPGENTLNLYPREKNAHINWLVVTADRNADIDNYQFGNGATPPPPPTTDPIIAISPTSLSFSAYEKGENPDSRNLAITNAGSDTLQWTATEQPDVDWLSIDRTSGSAGDHISVSVDIAGKSTGNYSTSIYIRDPNADNDSVRVPISLKITTEPEGEIIAIFEVENNFGLPNDGWEVLVNENQNCLRALKSSISAPNEAHRLDFSYEVPDGISTVFIFAEVDVNKSYNDDSFWYVSNNADTCEWNNLKKLGDGWNRAWVYNYQVDQQHAFEVSAGTNVVSLYPRETNAHINWFVVTTNPDLDIATFNIENAASHSIASHNVNELTTALSDKVVPDDYHLHQNYPNPFNPRTKIQFDLPEDTHVKFVIYNSLGQKIRELADRNYTAGQQVVMWDGTNDSGIPVSSGAYHGVLITDNYRKIVRMIYVK